MAKFTREELSRVFKTMKSKGRPCDGLSPRELRDLEAITIEPLVEIFNYCLEAGTFPESWLQSKVIFNYKSGARNLPSNYRTIQIQQACMKLFSKCIAQRLNSFLEGQNILHSSQFAYRMGHSTLGAAAILFELAREKLKLRKSNRLFVCFVDFRKAFDWVQRKKLAEKLLRFGMPKAFIDLILYIFNNNVMSVGTKYENVGSVKGTIGVLQGDPISCCLFNAFVSDLSADLEGFGPTLQGIQIGNLSYADDVALLAESAMELNQMLKRLERYCEENGLIINTEKTKVMVFGYGPIPLDSKTFHLQGVQLEIVNEFKYLGVIFTPQLTFTKHLEGIIARAKSRIGVVFANSPVKEVNLDLAKQLFQCYVQPILEYCMIIWTANYANSMEERLDVVQMVYFKRYCGLHPKTRNALVYFLTETAPLSETLQLKAMNQKEQIKSTFDLNIEEFLLVKERNRSPPNVLYSENIVEKIPSKFWCHEAFVQLPSSFKYRRNLCVRIVDGYHRNNCQRLVENPKDFHLESEDEKCKCKHCGKHLEWLHLCEI